ncbi:hypothetical protein A6V39_04705 [Candidatus Mycoplasma haematobovis]|uniref:Uncharacterized protein n=1 Tax=Candidatus Mycoplasma haematobovis TaxID=432608 RepID=A0A1A9QCW0_9MOLU|nr:hypothetical protein [Candidatus Mycoplasma haematobovis]OAL09851.1 hypothetical protein A6V39_04705 [Candidatus Mycoplasma haematobovis]
MSFPIKTTVGCLGGLTVCGCLLGSNYVFTKEKLVDIKDKNSKAWDTKITLLLNKIISTVNNREIIDKISQNNPGILITTSGKFSNSAKAKEALQNWCKKNNKYDQKLVEELCKVKDQVGWMSK